MKHEEQTRLMAMGILAELPEEHRAKVQNCLDELKAVMVKHGEHSVFAFGVLGAQIQAQETDEALREFLQVKPSVQEVRCHKCQQPLQPPIAMHCPNCGAALYNPLPA
jgi:Zn finger protein HypA/HybF involved in hydrogenase expression